MHTGGIAFTIALETMGIFAITALRMYNSLSFRDNFLLESMGVVGLDPLDGGKYVIVMKAVVFAIRTRTAFTLLPCRKAIAIHLKTSTFFAFAGDLIRVGSFALANL